MWSAQTVARRRGEEMRVAATGGGTKWLTTSFLLLLVRHLLLVAWHLFLLASLLLLGMERDRFGWQGQALYELGILDDHLKAWTLRS